MQLMSQDYHENSFDLLFTQQDPETPRDPTLGTAKNSFPSFSSRQEFGGNSNPPPQYSLQIFLSSYQDLFCLSHFHVYIYLNQKNLCFLSSGYHQTSRPRNHISSVFTLHVIICVISYFLFHCYSL